MQTPQIAFSFFDLMPFVKNFILFCDIPPPFQLAIFRPKFYAGNNSKRPSQAQARFRAPPRLLPDRNRRICYSATMICFDKEMKMLVKLQRETEKMPPLSDLEQAKFELSLAIDQLYYSSKLAGITLTKEMLHAAIYGAASR